MMQTGGVDWIARWEEMRRAVAAVRPPQVEGDRWRHRAARFEKISDELGERLGLPAVLAERLRADDVVVDIGAGTGRHALLFAGRCAKVIAVEPSAAMRARLARKLAEAGIGNVEIVDATWPADGIEGDVVFSSHVLYGVDDAAGFLAAMTTASRRVCALYLGLAAPNGALDRLWAHLHGIAVPQRPAALEAFAMLHQMGHEASCTVVEGSTKEFAFGGAEGDVIELCHRLDVEPDEARKARVRAGLGEIAPADARGIHVLGRTGPNALILWDARRP
jgi:SAM-dependent methyltransferase